MNNFDSAYKIGTLWIVIISISHLFIALISIIFNMSVIVVAVLAQWPELDNLSYVLVVSLAFSHMLKGLFVYLVTSFTTATEDWVLGVLWCWWQGIVSMYLESVTIVHIMLIIIDVIVFQYSDIRKTIAVSLSKRICIAIWAVSMCPQFYPFLRNWNDKQLYAFDVLRGGCFERYVFVTYSRLMSSIAVFVIFPIFATGFYYILVLFREEGQQRLSVTINKTIIMKPNIRYNAKATASLITFYFSFHFFHFILGCLNIIRVSLPEPYYYADNIWTEVESFLSPLSLLLTCKTYRHNMAQLKCLRFLKYFSAMESRVGEQMVSPSNNENRRAIQSIPIISIDDVDQQNASSLDKDIRSNAIHAEHCGKAHATDNPLLFWHRKKSKDKTQKVNNNATLPINYITDEISICTFSDMECSEL